MVPIMIDGRRYLVSVPLSHQQLQAMGAVFLHDEKTLTMHDVAETVFAHPTLSEAIKESAEDALGMGLHLPPRKILRATVGA